MTGEDSRVDREAADALSFTHPASQIFMLHRMTLRVLPSLSQAVTTVEVRRLKRVVMLLPGLVAFSLYRLAKLAMPISDIWVVLALSGAISTATAIAAYRIGRRSGFKTIWEQDGQRRLGWVAGWVGCVYGLQLSLMVLALLKVVVRYDFLLHPDGPAMMAIIIACTSVARDAFEIGHIRQLQCAGYPVVTFPDGLALRSWLITGQGSILGLLLLAATMTGGLSLIAVELAPQARSELAQLLIVSTVSGTLALAAYLIGKAPDRPWDAMMSNVHWIELFRFWWWPGLAFAATYYLSLQGLFLFIIDGRIENRLTQVLMAGVIAAGMTAYCSYLGHRRAVEDRLYRTIPQSLLRCPFVFGILTKRNDPLEEESSARAIMNPPLPTMSEAASDAMQGPLPETTLAQEGRRG